LSPVINSNEAVIEEKLALAGTEAAVGFEKKLQVSLMCYFVMTAMKPHHIINSSSTLFSLSTPGIDKGEGATTDGCSI